MIASSKINGIICAGYGPELGKNLIHFQVQTKGVLRIMRESHSVQGDEA